MLSCDLEPKVINTDTIIESSGVDPIRYKKWSELDFDEAVIKGYDEIRSDLVAVTIHLPLWLRTEVSNINLDTNVSQGRLYTTMVNYGCTLMKPLVDEPIKTMHNAYRVLGTSDNTVIMHMMQGMTISVNGVKGSGRKTLSVPAWCKNFMGGVAGRLRMDFSSVVRLALYMAISHYNGLLEHNEKACQKELKQFKKTLDDHMFVCMCLAEKVKQKED